MFGKHCVPSHMFVHKGGNPSTSGNIASSEYDDTAITKSSVANGLKVSFFSFKLLLKCRSYFKLKYMQQRILTAGG